MVLRARLSSRSLVIAAFALVAVAIVASFAGRSVSAATVTVEAGNDYFCSSAFVGTVCETDITAGDTVTWTITGGTHTVTQCTSDFSQCPPASGWDSGILTQNATYSQTFAAAGTYAYRCELHPSEMLGKIVVAAPVTASPTPAVTAGATNVPAAASSTVTPAAIPKTGGAPQSGESMARIAIAVGLLAAAGAVFAYARKSA